jgi:hypothetical protein
MQQVIVQLFNGLGNQLFQYAAGRTLASRLGASLRLVHHDPEAAQPGRRLLLQQFAIANSIERMSSLDRLVVSTKPQLRLPSHIVRLANRTQVFYQDPGKVQHPFEFDVEPTARSIYLSGYFQEHGLVTEIDALLRRELVLRDPLHWQSQQYADRIRAARRPISIHLRRGDYLTTFGPDGLLSMSYYEHAMQQMQDRFSDASFFVFSDDIEFARFWASSNARMTVVDCNDDARAHECMVLMSLCQHHIIANSTFSWWGAWLNARRDKQVIAPDNWLGVRTSRVRVACPEWQLLPAQRSTDWPTLEPWAARSAGVVRGQRRLNG